VVLAGIRPRFSQFCAKLHGACVKALSPKNFSKTSLPEPSEILDFCEEFSERLNVLNTSAGTFVAST
jgi:hypothetical protein